MAILPPTLQQSALEDALKTSTREVFAVVTLDWDRNGTFAGVWSDLSEIAVDAVVDRSYSSSLPEGLNVAAGFASGELRITFAGSRTPSEASALLLFDPYSGISPLASYEVLATPVDLKWRTRTAIGDIDTQAFNGYVRSFKLNRAAGTVELICSDNLDIASADVTLPRWAAATTSPKSKWYRGSFNASVPMYSQWAVEEILRQSGRATTRQPRADALFYSSLRGSSLPSIGSVANAYQLGPNPVDGFAVTSEPNDTLVFAAQTQTLADDGAPYSGVPLSTNTLYSCAYLDDVSGVAVTVPANGSGAAPVDVASTVLFQPTTASASTTYLYQSSFFLEDYRTGEEPFADLVTYEDPWFQSGRVSTRIQRNNTLTMRVAENMAIGFQRVWQWTAPLPTGTTASEPIELYTRYRFTSNSVSAEFRINGVVQTLTAAGANPSGVGFRYRSVLESDISQNGGVPRNARPNVVWNQVTEGPRVSDVEWFGGHDGVTWQPRPVRGLRPNGSRNLRILSRAQRAFRPLMYGLLYNMPEVNGEGGWETLAKIVAAESGLIWTDEYGTLNIANASYHQLPSVPSVTPQITVSDDQLYDLIINPTDDNRRNSIVVPGTFKGSTQDYVYTAKGAKDRYTPSGSPEVLSEVLLPEDVVMYNTRILQESATPPTDSSTDSIDTGHASAVRVSDPTVEGTDWTAFAYPITNPRVLGMGFRQTSADALYIGAYKGANQPNLRVTGIVTGPEQTITTRTDDAASVASIGRRSLVLESNPWAQSEYTAQLQGAALLQTLVSPAPIVEDLVVPADPRRQMFDVVYLANETGNSGAIFAQILSKTTRWSASEFTDTLKLRLINEPGTAVWDGPDGWDDGTWA